MPRNHDIKKVLVIGSGPIVIGQAAEFDYAGTQACRSLKEEGVEVNCPAFWDIRFLQKIILWPEFSLSIMDIWIQTNVKTT